MTAVSEPTEDDWRDFHRVVNEGMVPQLQNSAIAVCVMPTDGADVSLDARFAVQLGAMILLDKPILVIQAPGNALPAKLEMVADKIVHADITTDAGQAILTEALTDFGIEFGDNHE